MRAFFSITKRNSASIMAALLLASAAGMGAPGMAAQTSAKASSPAAKQTESERLNAFFAEVFDRDLARSPMSQTYLGIKTDYGKWDDISEKHQDEDIALVRHDLSRLHHEFDPKKLTHEAYLSYRIFELQDERQLEGDRWRHYDYPVNQMFGWQSNIPSFLINMHRVTDKADAEAYISRLEGVKALMDEVIQSLKIRARDGVVAPKFTFPLVISDSRNIITGAPFTKGDDSPLYADFKKKVAALKLDAAEQKKLVDDARKALLHSVKPAYESLIAELKDLEPLAKGNNGVWALPDGKAYYNYELRYYTTTDLTADTIHKIGLKDVDRIHNEMRAIMKKVGLKGTLQDFFAFMRTDKQFYYPNTDAGREHYLSDAKNIIATVKGRLDDVFDLKPKADLIVKRVEPFREKSAGKAFYQQPALDGSRPGIFYVNLHDMSQMPTYQLPALAYHEGIPGHHMQIAINQEIKDLPRFRKLAYFGAYTEGWGLYSEQLPKEMGLYKNPYNDFGRLAMEIWRSARLVVDTGIHAQKWTREQAIAYLDKNTPNPHADNVRAIERYLVMPGQATTYKIGMRKILELRRKAKEALGPRFDIRQFHDVVLRDGAVPLPILQEQVDDWIAKEKKSKS